MRVTRDKNCYCETCGRYFHYLGIMSHRAMHRRKKESCVIEFTDGSRFKYLYNARELQNNDTIK